MLSLLGVRSASLGARHRPSLARDIGTHVYSLAPRSTGVAQENAVDGNVDDATGALSKVTEHWAAWRAR